MLEFREQLQVRNAMPLGNIKAVRSGGFYQDFVVIGGVKPWKPRCVYDAFIPIPVLNQAARGSSV